MGQWEKHIDWAEKGDTADTVCVLDVDHVP